MLYFFLSYAHSGDSEEDRHVTRLYKDLCTEVLVHSDYRGAVGFLDATGIRAGERWPDSLVDALATCRAFIALCGPRYFSSEACGREWAVFTHRLALAPQRRGQRPAALVPLRWVKASQMHPIADQYQHDDESFGQAYRDHCVRDLILIKELKDGYRKFVNGLARRIIDIATSGLVPEYPGDRAFETFENAFSLPLANPIPSQRPESPLPPPPDPPKPVPAPGVRPILTNYSQSPDETAGR